MVDTGQGTIAMIGVHRQGGHKEKGAALVIALLLMVLLVCMGTALLGMSEAESQIAANDQWSEAAFQAADAAVQVGLDQLSVANTGLTVPETTISGNIVYRSGGRDDTTPQAPVFQTTTTASGYSLAASTGYNSGGYAFRIYRVNGTGTGPRNTAREVEVEVALGPFEE
jgi:hypothetical protein